VAYKKQQAPVEVRGKRATTNAAYNKQATTNAACSKQAPKIQDIQWRSYSRSCTRRQFFKTAATIGFAAAALGGTSLLSGCRSEAGDEIFRDVRNWTDDAGREIQIPTANAINSVYFTSGLAQVFILTLAPEVMGASCSKFSEEDMKYLSPELQGLKYLGAVESGEMDVEAVMAQDIQIIFSISSIELTQANIDEAVDIQDRSGIPVVLIDGSFSKIAEAYEKLGDILGCESRAKELSDYCVDAHARVTEAVKDIAEEDKVRFYYAEGPKGLQTEPAESQHAESFIVAGGYDVASVEWFDATGMADVSLESVIGWNPEVIVTWDSEIRGGAEDIIRASADWAVIDAVKNERVYAMPNVPLAWVDRPMACNRYLGIQWLANMFYPDKFDVDMVEVGKEFYKLFFGVDVTDEEMKGFLGNSYPPRAFR
jgi:iron complex transport system substrate-binding protein